MVGEVLARSVGLKCAAGLVISFSAHPALGSALRRALIARQGKFVYSLSVSLLN